MSHPPSTIFTSERAPKKRTTLCVTLIGLNETPRNYAARREGLHCCCCYLLIALVFLATAAPSNPASAIGEIFTLGMWIFCFRGACALTGGVRYLFTYVTPLCGGQSVPSIHSEFHLKPVLLQVVRCVETSAH